MKHRLALIGKIKFLASTWFDIYHSFTPGMFWHKTFKKKKKVFITHQTNVKSLRKQNWQITGMMERNSKGWVRKRNKEKMRTIKEMNMKQLSKEENGCREGSRAWESHVRGRIPLPALRNRAVLGDRDTDLRQAANCCPHPRLPPFPA